MGHLMRQGRTIGFRAAEGLKAWHCDTPTCASKRKSIRRSDIEDGTEALLRSLEPAKQLFALGRGGMFKDAWETRLSEAQCAKDTLHAQIKTIEDQIDTLLDRIQNDTQ